MRALYKQYIKYWHLYLEHPRQDYMATSPNFPKDVVLSTSFVVLLSLATFENECIPPLIDEDPAKRPKSSTAHHTDTQIVTDTQVSPYDRSVWSGRPTESGLRWVCAHPDCNVT